MIDDGIGDLTEDNFVMLAIKAYDKTGAIMSEFEEDLKRLKYIKRLFKKYKTTDVLKERLILNHIIILNNIFGAVFTTKMLFLKTDEEDWPILKTFLLFLNLMPDIIYGVDSINIVGSSIPLDQKVIDALRQI